MKVSVHLLETRNGRVSKRTRLCEVSGKVPVYADDGSAAGVYGRQIAGCRMPWQGGYLPVEVRGAVAVAPGPVWTPLIPASLPEEKVQNFGTQVPMKRPAQPCELAPVYVMLATDEASYVSGATVAVTGGKPLL